MIRSLESARYIWLHPVLAPANSGIPLVQRVAPTPPPNRRQPPINPELPIVLPGDGLVTLMQIDAPTYSRIWHNSVPSYCYYTGAAAAVSSGLLNEVKTSRLSRNVQFWLNLGERGGWMFVFSGLPHSHDNGLSVATFPPTAPPQDMLTRRGWWLVCTWSDDAHYRDHKHVSKFDV